MSKLEEQFPLLKAVHPSNEVMAQGYFTRQRAETLRQVAEWMQAELRDPDSGLHSQGWNASRRALAMQLEAMLREG